MTKHHPEDQTRRVIDRYSGLARAARDGQQITDCGRAAALLARLAARPGLDPADPALTQIAALCGRLPLALGMVARQLYHHPAWTPGAYRRCRRA